MNFACPTPPHLPSRRVARQEAREPLELRSPACVRFNEDRFSVEHGVHDRPDGPHAVHHPPRLLGERRIAVGRVDPPAGMDGVRLECDRWRRNDDCLAVSRREGLGKLEPSKRQRITQLPPGGEAHDGERSLMRASWSTCLHVSDTWADDIGNRTSPARANMASRSAASRS